MTPEAHLRLRDLEPPLGAKRRVLDGIEAQLDTTPKRRLRWLWLAMPIASVAVLVVWLQSHDSYAPESKPLVESVAVSPSNMVAPPPIKLAADDRMTVALPDAKLIVTGPAALALRDDQVYVSKGTLRVNGSATINAPMCRAQIVGSAKILVSTRSVQVSVFAGSAEVFPKSASCTVMRVPMVPLPVVVKRVPMTPLPTRDVVERPKPVTRDVVEPTPVNRTPVKRAVKPTSVNRAPAPPKRTAAPAPIVPLSPVRRQVAQFRRANALSRHDDRAAIAGWRKLIATWPNTSLRQDAESSILEALARIGQWAQLRAGAREFLRRYPTSTHVVRVRALLKAAVRQ